MTGAALIERLSARQAKVLRYLATTRQQPVAAQRVIVKTVWSDLPQTYTQALRALAVLHRHKLVERVDKQQYTITEAGQEAVKYMNEAKLFQAAPLPAVTNPTKREGKT